MTKPPDIDLSCPVPFSSYERVVLAHGGGGRVMHRLIDELFARAFAGEHAVSDHDGAVLDTSSRTAFTTDAFTVSPLFFPGGDIGRLAVCGTVNDVAMCGARPRYLSCAFVLEEGLPLTDLARIVDSMAAAAREAGVEIVTGDTKVVERGKGDGVYITTTGVGDVIAPRPVAPSSVQVGDAVIVSGPLGDHGVAIMAAREGIGFTEPMISDVAPVAGQVVALFEAGVDVHCLRDPTRGGLTSAVVEIASASGHGVRLVESSIPIREPVADACELLGLDPLYVAFVGASDAERAARILGNDAAVMGSVVADHPRTVVVDSAIGGERILDLLSGEQLPRIC
jgi:hydrogenase expression/formation protein HypE